MNMSGMRAMVPATGGKDFPAVAGKLAQPALPAMPPGGLAPSTEATGARRAGWWRRSGGITARLVVVTAAAVVLGACVTMKVASKLEPGTDVTRYHVFGWAPAAELATGDPRLDNNPFFHNYLRGAVERQLLRKGYASSTTTAMAPDLLLHYHANINQRIDVEEVDRAHGYCSQDCRPGVIEYDQGTLGVDIVDARASKVIWRGWAQDSVQGLIDNQAAMEREIDTVVTRMMASFGRAR